MPGREETDPAADFRLRVRDPMELTLDKQKPHVPVGEE
jgi:hypothetical protein